MTRTPHPFQIRKQSATLAAADISGSFLQARMDRFMRSMLLRAYVRHGNKTRAAKALGVTFRTFRYHWARLMQP